jgi:hypothetical protein
VVQLIHQSSANTARVCLPCVAKADTKYVEGKVRSGDIVDSGRSKFSPDSEVSDEDQDSLELLLFCQQYGTIKVPRAINKSLNE